MNWLTELADTLVERGGRGRGYTEVDATRRAWINMRQRCQNVNHPQWKDYGGRGITVCPEWESSERFFQDMGVRPNPKMTLERVDNSKGYSKENCIWATMKMQAQNKRLKQGGHTGVCFIARDKVWAAYGGRVQLYWGRSFEQAMAARLRWEEDRDVN